MRERRLAERMLPQVARNPADLNPPGSRRASRIPAFDRIRQWTSLRMALDAGVLAWTYSISRGFRMFPASGMPHMLASGPWHRSQPTFHPPLVRVDVVIDGVAAIACRTSGPLHIVGGLNAPHRASTKYPAAKRGW